MQAALKKELLDDKPEFCDVCLADIVPTDEYPGFSRCHECEKAVCPKCDHRGVQPELPSCPEHA